MKNLFGFTFVLLILLLQISCIQSKKSQEDLLTAIPHVEDSIIYDIPETQRLCDEMNIEKQYISINDCKLYCEIEGKGIPLVLIHGGPGGTHHCFHPWLTGVKDKFKIIYYDQRGCGLSDFNAGEGYSFEQTVNDLENLRKALKIDKWIVLGHSFGGAVAQYYTIKYPQNVLGQILVASVPMINNPELNSNIDNSYLTPAELQKINEIQKFSRTGKLTLAQYFYNNNINGGWKNQNFLKPTRERQAQLATYDIVFDPAYSLDYSLYNFNHAFENCPIPTLICEGKYDFSWSSKKDSIFLNNHPNAKYIHFEFSSHNIYSDEPEEFIKVIANWAETLKIANNNDISNWESYTSNLLGVQIDLIESNKKFIRLIKNDGVVNAKKYYEDFKSNNPEKAMFIENAMVRIGYEFLFNNKTDEAFLIFEMNVQEYPDSWNAYDCLGEVYMKLGNKKQAIQNYEKSLKLNPDNTNAVEMLKKLSEV